MRLLFWNIQGIGNNETQIYLLNMVRYYRPFLLFLAQPMVSFSSVPIWVWHNVQLNNHTINIRENNIPNLSDASKSHLAPIILLRCEQCIVLSCVSDNTIVYVASIYAHTNYVNRKALWEELSVLLSTYSRPWLLLGDFNSILGAHEKYRGRAPLNASCSDFTHWSNFNSLIHLDTKGARYTWSNNKYASSFIAQRLDTEICNEAMLDSFYAVSCNTLLRSHSDHFPIIVNIHKTPPVETVPRLKFFKVWTSSLSFQDLVSSSWKVAITGSPMYVLKHKLKHLKPLL